MPPKREIGPNNNPIFTNDIRSLAPKHASIKKTNRILTRPLAYGLLLHIKIALEDYRLLKVFFDVLFFVFSAILNIEIESETKTVVALAATITSSIARKINKRIAQYHRKQWLRTKKGNHAPRN